MASVDDILNEVPDEEQERLGGAGGASLVGRADIKKKERPVPAWLKKPFVIMYGIIFLAIVFVGMFLILQLSERPSPDGEEHKTPVSGTVTPEAGTTNTPEPLITHVDGTTATPTQKPGITAMPGYTEPTRDPNRPSATPTKKPISPTPELTPEISTGPEVSPTPEVTPELTPEATPTPEITPEATPTPEVQATPTPAPPTEAATPTPTSAPIDNSDPTQSGEA